MVYTKEDVPSFVSAGPAGGWLRHAFRRHGNGSGLAKRGSAACCPHQTARNPDILRPTGSAAISHAAQMPRPRLPPSISPVFH